MYADVHKKIGGGGSLENASGYLEMIQVWRKLQVQSFCNEQLIHIDLIVDIESKPDFRYENPWFGEKVLEYSPLIMSHSQYCTVLYYSMLIISAPSDTDT